MPPTPMPGPRGLGRIPRAVALLCAIVAVLLSIAACGGGGTSTSSRAASPPPSPTTVAPAPTPPPVGTNTCPQAADGHGAMGACAPRNKLGLTLPHAAPNGVTYPDLSNNDPVYNMAAVKAHGHPAVYLKTHQGTGFIDQTFRPMRDSAWRAGLAVGGYDFVSSYTAAEANLFVRILKDAGMTKTSARWLPPVLDVEYGAANRPGLQTMVDIVRAAFGRVAIYTGAWYWTPHFGCWWPAGVTGWISGYPTAPSVCGLAAPMFLQHQYTDHGFNGANYGDMTVFRGASAAFSAFARLSPAPRPTDVLTAGERRLLAAYHANATPAKRDAALDPLARQIRLIRKLGHPNTGHRAQRYTLLAAEFNRWSTPSYLTAHEKALLHRYYGSSTATKRATLTKLAHERDLITRLAHQKGHGGWSLNHRGARRAWHARFVAHRS